MCAFASKRKSPAQGGEAWIEVAGVTHRSLHQANATRPNIRAEPCASEVPEPCSWLGSKGVGGIGGPPLNLTRPGQIDERSPSIVRAATVPVPWYTLRVGARTYPFGWPNTKAV